MRRYDGHEGPDPRRPELVSDPALDPDPILCSLVYTLSGPRAATLFRHEASVDRRFSATLKELTTLQAQRRDATATASTTQAAGPLYEPRLQRALDHHRRETAPANPHRDPFAPATPTTPALNPATRSPAPQPDQPVFAAGLVPTAMASNQAFLADQSQSADPSLQPCPPPDQNEPGIASAQKEPNTPSAIADDPGAPNPMPPDCRIEPSAATPPRSSAAALAAKLHEYGIEPTAAAYLAGEDTGFLSVLPCDHNQPSSIPAHWPGAVSP
jgi:hypothetical protein